MKKVKATVLHYSLFFLLAAAGCCPHAPPATQPYTGDTESMDQVVAQINANNEKIPALWSELTFKTTIIDQKTTHSASGDGVLMYRRPSDFRLVLKVVTSRIFDIGTNSDGFWLATGPDTGNTIWWGRYADLQNVDPSRLEIPIRPDLVSQVLAVGVIDTNFLQPPVPTMRFDAYADAYVFIWNIPGSDRWLAQREVWYDRATLRPKRIQLYDTKGRVVLRADLDPRFYDQIEIPGAPKENWPWIARDYQLRFPDSGSTMEITLAEGGVMLHNGPRPSDQSFALPPVTDYDHQHQIAAGG